MEVTERRLKGYGLPYKGVVAAGHLTEALKRLKVADISLERWKKFGDDNNREFLNFRFNHQRTATDLVAIDGFTWAAIIYLGKTRNNTASIAIAIPGDPTTTQVTIFGRNVEYSEIERVVDIVARNIHTLAS